jgi:hypothetical protein
MRERRYEVRPVTEIEEVTMGLVIKKDILGNKKISGHTVVRALPGDLVVTEKDTGRVVVVVRGLINQVVEESRRK